MGETRIVFHGGPSFVNLSGSLKKDLWKGGVFENVSKCKPGRHKAISALKFVKYA